MHDYGNLYLSNVTIAGNVADQDGDDDGDGGGLAAPGDSIFMHNSIIAGNDDDSNNSVAPDCSVSDWSLSHPATTSLAMVRGVQPTLWTG